MNGKYPTSLFWIGFLINLIGKFYYLFLPSVILLIFGIRNKTCLYIGLPLLLIDIIISFIYQFVLRNAVLKSDNPDFEEFQDTILSPDWKDNIQGIVEYKIENSDDSSED